MARGWGGSERGEEWIRSYQKVVVAIARHGGHFGQNVVLIKGVRGGAKVDSRTTVVARRSGGEAGKVEAEN